MEGGRSPTGVSKTGRPPTLAVFESATSHSKRTSGFDCTCVSTAFKKVLPDLYKAYTKQVASRRFTITA